MSANQPTPKADEPRKPRGRGRLVTAIWITLILVCTAAYFILYRTVPLEISKETTYITGPLKSDGKRVDYFAAWEQETYPRSIATEQNGYRLVVQHLGMAPEATKEHFAGLCTALGLDADSIQPDMKFTDPQEVMEAYVESSSFDNAVVERLLVKDDSESESADELEIDPQVRRMLEQLKPGYLREDPALRAARETLKNRLYFPWTLDDLPMMEAWLAENGPALDLIGEAVVKPTFHIPFVRKSEEDLLIELSMPEVQQTRAFARALSTRANHRVATGDIDGAIDDIVACARLGRHVEQQKQLIAALVGVAIEAMANCVGIAGAPEHSPTSAQLDRLMREMDGLPAKIDISTVFPFERFAALDAVQAVSHNKCSFEDFGLPNRTKRSISINWNVVARRVNEQYDLLPTGKTPSFSANKIGAIFSVRSRSRQLGDLFVAIVFPASEAGYEASRRSTCFDRMHKISLAMLLYERDHGALPPACTVDSDGTPLHSWRVLLLPYLGQQELYDKIRLDEPWDSAHNKQFHCRTIDFYQCPSANLATGQTSYCVIVGPQAAFRVGEGKPFSEFGPRSSRMILVTEQQRACCWMDPTRDLSQEDAEKGVNPRSNLPIGPDDVAIRSPHPGGVNCGLRDGSVDFLSETLKTEHVAELVRGERERIP